MKLHRNTWQGCFHTGRRDLKINDNGTEITSGRGIDNLPPKFEVMFFLLYNTHPGWGVLGLLGVVRFAGGCSRFGFEERFARGIRFGFEERFPGGVQGLDSKKGFLGVLKVWIRRKVWDAKKDSLIWDSKKG